MADGATINKIIAVSNTGPLISALQCGRTDLLKRYFSVIYITASELTELDKHGWLDDVNELIDEGFVVVGTELTEPEKAQAEHIAQRIATDPTSQDPEWRNHLPEAEAMVMAQQSDLMVDQILLDEKAARKVAQELGLQISGFPGVLGRAGLDGLLTKDEIRQVLKMCQQQGTHYSGALIETVAQTYGR